MNNDNFLIESSDIELARDICKYISDPDLRSRAVANALAANIAIKYFSDVEKEVDIDSGLHNVAAVLNNIEISDIYINNAYIDVRLYFNENELCVPKAHFDNNILPVAYMFIKLDEDLSSGLVTGFIPASEIDTSVCKDGYYGVKESDLQSFYDIESLLYTEPFDNIPMNFESQIFDYLDNKLENCSDFYKVLINSKEYRLVLINSAKAQIVFNFISTSKTETKDVQSLVDNSLDYSGEEEDINLDEGADKFELLDENIDSLEEFDSLDTSLEEYEPIEDIENEEAILPIDLTVDEEIEHIEIEENLTPIDIADSDEIEEIEEIEHIEIEDSSIESNLEELPVEENILVEETPDELNNNIVTDAVEDHFEALETIDNIVETDNSEDFSTVTTPSLESFETDSFEENDDHIFDEIAEETASELQDIEENTNEIETEEKVFSEVEISNENNAEIEDLFGEQNVDEDVDTEFIQVQGKKSSVLPMLGVLAIIAAAGYFGYTKFAPQNDVNNNVKSTPVQSAVNKTTASNSTSKDAMPIESVENVKTQAYNNEGNAVSIPAIENSLDASIAVSNLTINWEVPTGYINNPSAKRYFVKIGKIIQLNLKTELLLLSKPPITNKIAVELEFNNDNNRFNVKQLSVSSGEKTIDDLIVKIINNTLNLSLSTNMSIFNNIKGNPVLIIHL